MELSVDFNKLSAVQSTRKSCHYGNGYISGENISDSANVCLLHH